MISPSSARQLQTLQSLRTLLHPQARYLSSRAASRPPNARLASRLTLPLRRPDAPFPHKSPFAFQAHPKRYASTETPASTFASGSIQPEPSPYYSEPSTTFDGLELEPDITPHIGYFKELGLEFGWGTTSIMQWVIEHIHVYLGTPWWATLVLTALSLRLVLIKPFIEASDQSARMALLSEALKPLQAKAQAARAAKDQIMMMTATNEVRSIQRDAGIKVWKGLMPVVLQIPLGFGIFRFLRNAYDIPMPGMIDGGVLWFQDLTISDPLLILPLALGALTYTTLRVTQNPKVSTMNPATAKLLRLCLPPLAGGFALLYPACLQLTFFTTTFLAFIQSWLLLQPGFRQWLRIQPLMVRKTEDEVTRTINIHGSKPAEENKNFINKTFSEIKEAGANVLESANKYANQTSKQQGGRSKQQIKDAKAYEERRRREIAQAKFEYEQEQEEQRRQREEQRRDR